MAKAKAHFWYGHEQLIRIGQFTEEEIQLRKQLLQSQATTPHYELQQKHLGKYDFVISTDILEHILAPVQQSFDNLLRLLKPEGHLVFSVPYTLIIQTVEHYPGLFDYEILNSRGEK